MLDYQKISASFSVTRLGEADADSVLALCAENAQFYRYCPQEATREQVLEDMTVTPPGKMAQDKYFLGFYRQKELIAVMDLIDGYPSVDTAYIGFFMVKKALQGQGIGSAIIEDTKAFLKSVGFHAMRLAINKGNPQSTAFWHKNGFTVKREVERGGYSLLVAEHIMQADEE